jgi:hypothetical protein
MIVIHIASGIADVHSSLVYIFKLQEPYYIAHRTFDSFVRDAQVERCYTLYSKSDGGALLLTLHFMPGR